MRKKLLEAIAKGLREVGVYNIDIDHISEAVRRHVEPLMNKTEFGLSERPQIQEEYITPVCPLAKAYENPQCRGKQCAWFDRENNRCAVLSLAETLSFLNDTVSMFYDKGGSHD